MDKNKTIDRFTYITYTYLYIRIRTHIRAYTDIGVYVCKEIDTKPKTRNESKARSFLCIGSTNFRFNYKSNHCKYHNLVNTYYTMHTIKIKFKRSVNNNICMSCNHLTSRKLNSNKKKRRKEHNSGRVGLKSGDSGQRAAGS